MTSKMKLVILAAVISTNFATAIDDQTLCMAVLRDVRCLAVGIGSVGSNSLDPSRSISDLSAIANALGSAQNSFHNSRGLIARLAAEIEAATLIQRYGDALRLRLEFERAQSEAAAYQRQVNDLEAQLARAIAENQERRERDANAAAVFNDNFFSEN